jgi:salicylate hydroxylase
MAVEDAAVLAECLSHVTNDSTVDSLRTALMVFEKTRQLRTTAVQEASLQAGNVLHLQDGPEQEARDAAMKSGAYRETINETVYGLADMRARDRWYGYDAVREVREEWARTIALINSQR